MAEPYKYSVIVPVYNRPVEVDELLDSLTKQTWKDFDILIVEDGSTEDCKEIVDKYSDQLDIKYFFKENSGPGSSRNFGMDKATGEFMIFFDSDCLIPAQYFEEVDKYMTQNRLDCWGGPDDAHPSFTIIQKAINYSMTSVITTGGVRGKENKLDKFQPRSFNMGISQEVYKTVGGFGDIHPGEDPDLSYRIMDAGFSTGLIKDAHVFHKRRIDFQKFVKQVYKFGVVRVILMKWYPERTKLTYFFPTTFLLGSVLLIALCILWSWIFITPLVVLTYVLFCDAIMRTKDVGIAALATLTSYIQLFGYGWGFLKSFVKIKVLKQHERRGFKGFFFDQSKLAELDNNS